MGTTSSSPYPPYLTTSSPLLANYTDFLAYYRYMRRNGRFFEVLGEEEPDCRRLARLDTNGRMPSRKKSKLGSALYIFSSASKRSNANYGIRVRMGPNAPVISLHSDDQLLDVLLKWRKWHLVIELYRYLVTQSRWENVYTLEMDMEGFETHGMMDSDGGVQDEGNSSIGKDQNENHASKESTPTKSGNRSVTPTTPRHSPKHPLPPLNSPRHRKHIFHRLQSKKTPREITFIFLQVICHHIDDDNFTQHSSFLNQFLFCVKHEIIMDQVERHSPLYQSNRRTPSSASTIRGRTEEKEEKATVQRLLSSMGSPDKTPVVLSPLLSPIKARDAPQQERGAGNPHTYDATLATFLSYYQANPFKEILIIDMKEQKIDFSRALFHCIHSRQLMEHIQQFFEHRLDLCFRNPFQQLRTCLHNAAMQYRLHSIKYLLDSGADPNTVDIFGNSPVMCMMSHYFNEIILMDSTKVVVDVMPSDDTHTENDDEGYFTDDENDKKMVRLLEHYDRKFRLLKQCLQLFFQYEGLQLGLVNHEGQTIRDIIKTKSKGIKNLHTTMEKNGELMDMLYTFELKNASRDKSKRLDLHLHQRSRSLSALDEHSGANRSGSSSAESHLPFCGDCHSTRIVPFDFFHHAHHTGNTANHVRQSFHQYAVLTEKLEQQQETIHRLRDELTFHKEYHRSLMRNVSASMSSLIRSLEKRPLENLTSNAAERKSVLLFYEMEEYYTRVCAQVLAGEYSSANPVSALYNPLDFTINDPKGEVRDFVQWKHVMWEWTLRNFNHYSIVVSLDTLLAMHDYNILPGDVSGGIARGIHLKSTGGIQTAHLPQLVQHEALHAPFTSVIFTPFSSSITRSPASLSPNASFFDMMKNLNKRPFLKHADDPETYFFTKLLRNVKHFVDQSEEYNKALHNDQPLAEYLAAIQSPLYGINLSAPPKDERSRKRKKKNRSKAQKK